MSRYVCEPCGSLFERPGSCPFCRGRLRVSEAAPRSECPNCGLEFASDRVACPLCQGRDLRCEPGRAAPGIRQPRSPSLVRAGGAPLLLQGPRRARLLTPSLVTVGLLLTAALGVEIVGRVGVPAPAIELAAAQAERSRAEPPAPPAEADAAERLNREGLDLARAGKLDEAILVLTRAVAADPRHVKSHNNLGVLYRRKGWAAQAIAAYQTATAIAPSNPVPYKNLGILYEDRRDLRDAAHCYAVYLALAPNAEDAPAVRAHLDALEASLRGGPLAAEPGALPGPAGLGSRG